MSVRLTLLASAVGALLWAIAPAVANAAVQYQVQESSGTSIVPGTTDIGNHCDDCVTQISFPFPVTFYGNQYTTAWASSNGNLQFGSTASTAFSNDCLPSSTLTDPTIAVFWDDLRTDVQPGEGIFTATNGSAPFRQFVVEWRAQTFSGGSETNFEIIFFENSDTVRTVYGTNTGATATVGVQSGSGSATQWECNVDSLPNGTRLDYIPTTTNPGQPGVPNANFVTPSVMTQEANPGVPYLISWAGGSCASGAIYRLQEEVNGGAFGTVFSGTAMSTTTDLYPGNSYQFLVDCGATQTAGPVFSINGSQESAASYSGNWTSTSFAGAWGGSAKYSTAKGASATFTCYCEAVTWVTDEDTTHGSAKVYIDGTLSATVSTHYSSKRDRVVVYKHGWSADGTHTIRIVNVATSGHPRVTVDGFVTRS